MKPWLFVLLVLCGLLSPSWGMMAQMTDQDKVGTADLIMIGTVLSTRQLPNVDFFTAGEAHVRVDRILKGEQVDEVVVRYGIIPPMQNNMTITDHNGMSLLRDSTHLFFLQRAQGGYAFVGGPMGMVDPKEADRVAALIADIPASVSFSGNVGPFLFGKRVELHMVARNTSKKPLSISAIDLELFVLSPRLGNYIPMTIVESTIPGQVPSPMVAYATPKRDMITPGGEYKCTMQVTCNQPAEWQFLGEESYLFSQAMVRARLFVQPSTEDAQPAAGNTVTSSWKLTFIGYPLYDSVVTATKSATTETSRPKP